MPPHCTRKYDNGVTKFVTKNDLAKKLASSSGKHFCTNAYVIDTLNLQTGNTPNGLLNSSKDGLAKEFSKFARGAFLYQAIHHIYLVLT